MFAKFVQIERTISAVPGQVPAPYMVRIDGTAALSAHFAARRDAAGSAVVREINALAYVANEELRARYAKGVTA